jgi:hypothetical protein
MYVFDEVLVDHYFDGEKLEIQNFCFFQWHQNKRKKGDIMKNSRKNRQDENMSSFKIQESKPPRICTDKEEKLFSFTNKNVICSLYNQELTFVYFMYMIVQ